MSDKMSAPASTEAYDYFRQFVATDGDLTPEQIMAVWTDRARLLARLPEADTVGKTVECLLLQVGQIVYAVTLQQVVSILPLVRITAVPRTPDFVVGVVSVRGQILSVVDTAVFLQGSETDRGAGKIVWVTDTHNQREVGLLIDDVIDIQTVFQADIQPPLSTQSGRQALFVKGILPDMSLLLNVDMLLAHPDFIVYEELL